MAGFSAKYGIEYPLLSDEGSATIQQLGLLNEEAAPQIAGIPHPGVFVLDAAGTVTEKRFYPSYRERDTGSGLLAHVLGIATPPVGPEVGALGDAVEVRAWFDNSHYAWGQRLWLTIELTVAAGSHINGPNVPEGYQPLTLALRLPERVSAGLPSWPPARDHTIPGIAETLAVYDGKVRVALPVSFMVVDAGAVEVGIEVTYQACTDIDCLLPATVSLALTVEEASLVERPKPAPSA